LPDFPKTEGLTYSLQRDKSIHQNPISRLKGLLANNDTFFEIPTKYWGQWHGEGWKVIPFHFTEEDSCTVSWINNLLWSLFSYIGSPASCHLEKKETQYCKFWNLPSCGVTYMLNHTDSINSVDKLPWQVDVNQKGQHLEHQILSRCTSGLPTTWGSGEMALERNSVYTDGGIRVEWPPFITQT
jgi:hypothetical protein